MHTYSVRSWCVALLLGLGGSGCDFDMNDIDLDELGAGPRLEGNGAGRGSDKPDGGKQPAAGGSNGMDGGASWDGGRTDKTAPAIPGKQAQADGGATAAAGDAGSNLDGSTEVDDDGGYRRSDPCGSSTFHCDLVTLWVFADDGAKTLDGATLTVTTGRYSFRTTSVDGRFSLQAPTDRVVWMRIEADGYWAREAPIAFFLGFAGSVSVFSTDYLASFVSQLRVDSMPLTLREDMGFVMAPYSGGVPGCGIKLGRESGPPFLIDGGRAFASDTLIAGTFPMIRVANVDPGELRLRPYGPPNLSCAVSYDDQFVYEAKPKTVLDVSVHCYEPAGNTL